MEGGNGGDFGAGWGGVRGARGKASGAGGRGQGAGGRGQWADGAGAPSFFVHDLASAGPRLQEVEEVVDDITCIIVFTNFS